MIPWAEIRDKILEKEPKAGPLLDIISKYWGDGQLTQELAARFIAAWAGGDYVEAKAILYGSMSAGALLANDEAENARLTRMVAQETKLYDFLGELEAALLKIALGAAIIAVGL